MTREINIAPPFFAKIVDEDGRISREWTPFFSELYEMLKAIKEGDVGNVVSIGTANRLADSDVAVDDL